MTISALAGRVDRKIGSWFGLGTALVALSAFSFEMPTTFSASGHLTVYYSELLAVMIGIALLVAAILSRYRPTTWARRMFWLLLAFAAWFVVVCIVRLASDGSVKQSLLVLRTTVLPLVAFFMVDAGWASRRHILSGMVLFNSALVLLHLPEWNNMRMSAYLGNSIVFALLIALLVPVNMMIFTGRHSEPSGVVRWAAALNLLAALVLPLWSGSRGVLTMVLVAVTASALVLRPGRQTLRKALAVVLSALVLHLGVWLFNPQGAAYGMYRLVPPPGQIAILRDLPFLQSFNTPDRVEHTEVAAKEMEKSDASRAELTRLGLAEVLEHPIFGGGQVYFEIDSYRGRAQYSSHNFILDHANAYGVPGLIMYAGFFFILLAARLRHWRLSSSGFIDNALSLVMTAVLMGVSLTQPTIMIQIVIFTYFVTVSALQKPDQGGLNTSGDPARDRSPVSLDESPAVSGSLVPREARQP